MEPSFTPISNIVVQNGFTLDTETTQNADLNYRSTFGQLLGLSYRLLPDTANLTLGLVTFLPLNQTMYIDTGFSYQPEYVLYRSRTQRPQIEMALGADLGRGFHFGAGVHVGYALTTNADATLQSATSNDTSSMRMVASMKPKASPYFGLLVAPPDDPGAYSAGIVVRLPLTAPNTAIVQSRARVTSLPANPIDFYFDASSALNYDPLTVELGGSYRWLSALRTSVQADFQRWAPFQAPVMVLKNNATSGIILEESKGPLFAYRNIWIPRVGQEVEIGPSTILRLGYAYRPSFIQGLPTGVGNYLDPPKHIFSAGAGFRFKSFLGLATPAQLDLHLSYHQLITQHVVKTSGDETGNASNRKIGAPGYDAGGRVLGGGLSLSLAL